MEVETFEMEVVTEAHPEVNEESLQLIKELGLNGQVPPEGQTIRDPYPRLSKDELFIYKTLCPQSYRLEDYSRTAIPLRVLQALAYCKEQELFKGYRIWDVEDTEVKDPVLIGIKNDDYEWVSSGFHIIARWGDVLDSLEVMRKQAVKIASQKYKDALTVLKREINFRDSGDLTMKELCDDVGRPIVPKFSETSGLS